MSADRARAALGPGRQVVAAPNRRRKCRCGCGGRVTHVGTVHGTALISGCELKVRRWARGAL